MCDVCDGSAHLTCPTCGHTVPAIDGFVAYAPDLARGGGGFKEGYFADLARLEDGNFWFRARNLLIQWAVEKYCQGFQSMLEIGCGTGYVLSGMVDRFPAVRFYASEIFTAGLGYAASRLPSVTLMQMDAREIPFESEFDVIGAFDVLEHIQEDSQVLLQIHAALKSSGFLLLSVPQHEWLWSPVDDYACHQRRYGAADLHAKLRAAGFDVLRSTSFVVGHLPAMYLSRLLQSGQRKAFDPLAEFDIPTSLNAVLFRMLAAELKLIKAGISFPMGGSRLVVARKR